MIEEILSRFSEGGGFALWLPFGTLLLCGLGLPVPEDIVLVAAGFLGAKAGYSFGYVATVMYFGILVGDTATFFLGRYFGRGVMNSRWGKLVFNADRISRAEARFLKSGSWVIFVGRFLPGLRAAIFFSGGLLKFSVWKFWLMDGLAAIISAPVFVWIGEFVWKKYGEDVSRLEATIGQTKIYLGIVIVMLVAGYFSYRFFQNRKILTQK